MSKLVDNEQRKLTATYINGIGIAIRRGHGGPGHRNESPALRWAAHLACCSPWPIIKVTSGVHFLARTFLKGLVE